ncbi:MAG: cobalamin B12-binding domain-containing protein, partial [Pseudomonadota bacterium]
MNILLVYPKHPDNTFWSFKHSLSFLCSKTVYPPLGLLTVASMLPEKWNKKLVDINVRELKDQDILNADIVFIGAMSVQNKSTLETIKRCKKFNKKVVGGGPLFSSREKEFEDVDHIILGEAENTVP